MAWHPFRHPRLVTVTQIAESERRERAVRLAQETEAYAARLLAKTKALREELERGPRAS